MFGEQSAQFARLTALALLLLLLAGAGAMNSSTAGASSGTSAPSCERASHFDPNNFSNPTTIDNEWSPLVPGTQLILEGFADGVPHRVVFTVTDLTKVINGVRTVVIWDRDFSEGEIVETELAFKAQDDEGNVWNLGEYPEEYEDGQLLGAPNTWIAGLEGAEAGILMQAEPRVGTGYYLQGWSPDIDFLDCAKVFNTGEKTCVPFNCYENVLVTDERSPLDAADGHQRKYYAPGVGNIQIGATGDASGEILELVKIVHLSPSALAKAQQEVLKLEKRAYQISDVYRDTPPLERR